MSTQSLQVQRPVVTHRNSRRLIAVASVAAALFVGTLIGRSTAPTASPSVVRPATELTGDPAGSTTAIPGGTARLDHQRI
jgi:hypothetical protein